MEEKSRTFEAELDMGALCAVPVWEDDRHGRNWLAKIARNPSAPGGLEREFAQKARGDGWYYILPKSWIPGTPVEFGADHFKRYREENRWYGWIISRTEEKVVFQKSTGAGRTAIKEAAEWSTRPQMETSQNPIIERKVIIDA